MPDTRSTKPPTTLRPQDGKIESVESDPSAAVSALALFPEVAGERLLPHWQSFFFDNGLEFLLHFPHSLSNIYAIGRREAPAFVLAHLSRPSEIGGHLSPLVPVASVYFPPLVVMLDWSPTAAEQEELRIQGASLVIDGVDPSQTALAVMTIAASQSWFRGSTERLSIVDLLQMFAQDRKSGLVTVACPHAREVSARSWRDGQGCNGDKSARCDGWYGRLYVAHGELIHAETPTSGGIPALSQVLELRGGTIRIHDVFLEPVNRNCGGSIQNNIMDAMVLADEQRRAQRAAPPPGAAPPRPAPPRPAPPRPSPSRNAMPSAPDSTGTQTEVTPLDVEIDDLIVDSIDESSTRNGPTTSTPPTGSPSMNTLGPILTITPGLSAAAKAGADGNVQEISGPVDGEALCAVAAMCGPPLQRVASLLAMGDLATWAYVNKTRSLYTVRSDDGLIVVTGEPTKNPDSTIKKIAGAVSNKKR